MGKDTLSLSCTVLLFSRKFRDTRGISLENYLIKCYGAYLVLISSKTRLNNIPRKGCSRWSDASDQSVPSYKLDCSRPLRDRRILTTCLGSQFNACSFDYIIYSSISQEDFTTSKKRLGHLVRGHISEGRNWNHLDQSCAVCERNLSRHCRKDPPDGPDNWVVDGAAHGVPGQAGARVQQVNW